MRSAEWVTRDAAPGEGRTVVSPSLTCPGRDGRKGRGGPRAAGRAAVLLAGALALPGGAWAQAERASAPDADAPMVAVWRTLRAVDCARCHGRDHDGLAAPSIVDYARTQTRDMFVRMVLDGEPGRGMPGYRNNPRVTDRIDDIYRYFLARAQGRIGRRPPGPAPAPGTRGAGR